MLVPTITEIDREGAQGSCFTPHTLVDSMPNKLVDFIEQVLQRAPEKCWLVVDQETMEILGTGLDSLAALRAASKNSGFDPEKVMIIWSPAKSTNR